MISLDPNFGSAPPAGDLPEGWSAWVGPSETALPIEELPSSVLLSKIRQKIPDEATAGPFKLCELIPSKKELVQIQNTILPLEANDDLMALVFATYQYRIAQRYELGEALNPQGESTYYAFKEKMMGREEIYKEEAKAYTDALDTICNIFSPEVCTAPLSQLESSGL